MLFSENLAVFLEKKAGKQLQSSEKTPDFPALTVNGSKPDADFQRKITFSVDAIKLFISIFCGW